MSRRDYPARRAWRTLGRGAGWLRARIGRLPVVRRLALPSPRRALDAVAVSAVGAAAATVAGVTPAWLVQSLASVARPVLGVLGVACVVLVLLGWNRDASDDWTETLREAAPERVPAGVGTPPGAWVTLAAGEENRIAEASLVGQSGDAVARDRLIEAATAAVAADRGVDEETAAEMVASGEWTDDPRAAAYLADGETPTVPPGVRLRDWLAGERTPRRVRAAVREIRRRVAVSPAVEADDGIDATATAASATLADAVGAGPSDDGGDATALDDDRGPERGRGSPEAVLATEGVVENAGAAGTEGVVDGEETAGTEGERVAGAEGVTGTDPETPAPDGGHLRETAGEETGESNAETTDSDDDSAGSTVRPTGLHATWWGVER